MFKKLILLSSPLMLLGCDKTNDSSDVNENPVAVISSDTAIKMAGENQVFTANNSSDSDGSITGYSWEVNNQIQSNSPVLNYVFDDAGNYVVRLTVTDDDGASHSASNVVLIEALPEINITQEVKNVSSGDPVIIDATTSTDNGNIQSFEWSLNNQVISTQSRLEYIPQLTGDLVITLTVTDDLGLESQQTFAINNSVDGNTKPTAMWSISALSALENEDIIFDASSSSDMEDGTNLSFLWEVDGVEHSNSTNTLTTSFSTVGTHNVRLTVSDSMNSSSSIIQSISVVSPQNSAPVANLTGDDVGVENNTFIFDAQSSSDVDMDVLTYKWFVNNIEQTGQTANMLSIELTRGTHIIKVEVSDSQNTSEATHSIIVNPFDDSNTAPVAALTAPLEADVDQSVTFNARDSYDDDLNDSISYKWFVDNVEQVGKTGVRFTTSFSQVDQYDVKVVVTDNGGKSDSETVNITINEVVPNVDPEASLTAPSTIEVNESVTFDASGSTDDNVEDVLSYQWFVNDSEVSNQTNSTYTTSFSEFGMQSVKVIVEDLEGATDEKTVSINVIASQTPVEPIANITLPSGGINAKALVILDASDSTDENNDIASYEWFVDGQLVGEGEILEYRFDTIGDKTLKLTVTDATGLFDEVTQNISIDTEIDVDPVAIITVDGDVVSGDYYILPGTSVDFSLTQSFDPNTNGGIGDKFWEFNGGQMFRSDTFSQTFDQEGVFTLALTVKDYTQAEGKNTLTIHVANENILPQINITGLSAIYDINKSLVVADASSSTDPDAPDSSLMFEWKLNNEVVSTDSVLTYNFDQEGDYTFELTLIDVRDGVVTSSFDVTAQDVPETAPVAVINLENPSGFAPFTTSFDALNSTDVNGNNTITSYNWKVDGQQISTEATFEYEFTNIGNYELSLIVTDETGLPSIEVSTTVMAEELDPNHPEVFTLLEDTGKMKIYKINNCGVSPEIIPNSGFVHVDASGTSVAQAGWNHIPVNTSRFTELTPGDYDMSSDVDEPSTDCSGVLTQHNVLVKRYSDWHNQHANGIDYAMSGMTFSDIDYFVVDLYIRSDRTEYLTPQELLDIYGPDSDIIFPMSAAEVEHMDVGHINLGFEIAKGDGIGSKVALANLSIDPKYMDQWIRIEMQYEDMWLFEKDQNYIPQDRTAAQLANETPDEIKLVGETESTDVYRNYRQNELHEHFNIMDQDLPNSVPKNYKVIDLEIKRMELIVNP